MLAFAFSPGGASSVRWSSFRGGSSLFFPWDFAPRAGVLRFRPRLLPPVLDFPVIVKIPVQISFPLQTGIQCLSSVCPNIESQPLWSKLCSYCTKTCMFIFRENFPVFQDHQYNCTNLPVVQMLSQVYLSFQYNTPLQVDLAVLYIYSLSSKFHVTLNLNSKFRRYFQLSIC